MIVGNMLNFGGSGPNLASKTVTSNGTYSAATDLVAGYSEVAVEILEYSGPYTVEPATAEQSFPTAGFLMTDDLTISGYDAPEAFPGPYTVRPMATPQTVSTSGYLMGQDFTVEAFTEARLITKTFEEGGSYAAADEGADGYSQVTASVDRTCPLMKGAYEGPYTITPSTSSITLSVRRKYMSDNLLIESFPWVNLSGKTVTGNGTYRAEDDNLDGYDTVNVAVPYYSGSYHADPTEDIQSFPTAGMLMQEDFTVGPMSGGGEPAYIIGHTVVLPGAQTLPEYIEITTPPNKMWYETRDEIDLTGIVVHAYYADGTDWGVVPFSELMNSPGTASGKNETITVSWNRVDDGRTLSTTYDVMGLPAYISITTLPTNLTYNAGETIDLTGIVVHAYYEDGIDWGVVPFAELMNSPGEASGGTPGALEQMSWSEISAIAVAGTGDTYFDIGEAKSITLNGQIGDGLTLDNYQCSVFILDFNHVDNGVADNNIIFGGFKYGDNNAETITVSWNRVGDGEKLSSTYTTKSSIKDIALVDIDYNDFTHRGKYFSMNHWGRSSPPYYTNYGGWKGCDLRYDILGGTSTQPSGYGSTKTTSCVGYDATAATITTPVTNTLMAALPSDFRNVLRLHTHYVDNKGNYSNTDANVTTVVDAIFLLAEFEVWGMWTNANQYEKNHQTQMTYYAGGNSKIKYKHNDTSTACVWWESSAIGSDNYTFCEVTSRGGTSYGGSSRFSLGLAPAFKV